MRIEITNEFLDRKGELPLLRAFYETLECGMGYFSISFRGERYAHDCVHRGSSSYGDETRTLDFDIEETETEETLGSINLVAESESDHAILKGALVFRKRSKETVMFLIAPTDILLKRQADLMERELHKDGSFTE